MERIRVRSKSGRFIALLPETLQGGFSVVATADGVGMFNNSWPCSRLPERAVRFEYASNGDLVDIWPEMPDGEELLALSHDAQEFGEGCIARRATR